MDSGKRRRYFDVYKPIPSQTHQPRMSAKKRREQLTQDKNNYPADLTKSNSQTKSYFLSNDENNNSVNRSPLDHQLRHKRYHQRQLPNNRKSKHKILKRVLLSLGVILAIMIGVGIFYGWSLNNLLKRISVLGLTSNVGGTENILIAGSTTRCGLKFQSTQWGLCSQVGADENSDIIMIAHLNPSTHQVSLLSIPRDTFVPNARSGNQSFKIDAALYQGPSQLVKAIEEDFGIPIQNYVEVNFDGFVNTVNAIGGIRMDFPMPVYDAYSHLNITKSGCTELNGITALQLIRARHLQYKPASITTNDKAYWPYENQSDIGRIARTHEFMRVLASTIMKKGISNPVTDERIISSILPNLTIDSGFNDSKILRLIEEFHNVNVINAPEYTLPIAIPPLGPYYFNGVNYGDVVFPVEPTDQSIINEFLGQPNNVNTMTGKKLPSPSSITVNVMSGSGHSGQSAQIASGLNSLGFNIGTVGDLVPQSSQAQETYVYYKSGDEAQAEAVAKQLTGYVIMALNSNKVTQGAQVMVITGTATGVNALVTSTSSQNSSRSVSTSLSTSTIVTSAKPSDGFSAPSNPQEGLTPWDPQACTD
jgi:LCP family protein required for cell wall assembly